MACWKKISRNSHGLWIFSIARSFIDRVIAPDNAAADAVIEGGASNAVRRARSPVAGDVGSAGRMPRADRHGSARGNENPGRSARDVGSGLLWYYAACYLSSKHGPESSMTFREFDSLLKRGRSAPSEPVRHHVVIIDDDPGIQDGLAVLLRDRYHLTLRSTAQEGVEAVDEDVCAVILDVKMVGLDGFWACNEIRKRSPSVPVIFYSAYQDVKNPYTIINDHRPFGYVVKGDNVQKLIDMLTLAVKLQATIVSNRKVVESLDRMTKSQR
jgi:CheY-like chemotaxis protein